MTLSIAAAGGPVHILNQVVLLKAKDERLLTKRELKWDFKNHDIFFTCQDLFTQLFHHYTHYQAFSLRAKVRLVAKLVNFKGNNEQILISIYYSDPKWFICFQNINTLLAKRSTYTEAGCVKNTRDYGLCELKFSKPLVVWFLNYCLALVKFEAPTVLTWENVDLNHICAHSVYATALLFIGERGAFQGPKD